MIATSSYQAEFPAINYCDTIVSSLLSRFISEMLQKRARWVRSNREKCEIYTVSKMPRANGIGSRKREAKVDRTRLLSFLESSAKAYRNRFNCNPSSSASGHCNRKRYLLYSPPSFLSSVPRNSRPSLSFARQKRSVTVN